MKTLLETPTFGMARSGNLREARGLALAEVRAGRDVAIYQQREWPAGYCVAAANPSFREWVHVENWDEARAQRETSFFA